MVPFNVFARLPKGPVIVAALVLSGPLGWAQVPPPVVGRPGSGAKPSQAALASGFYNLAFSTGALAGPGLAPPLVGVSLDRKAKTLLLFLPDGSFKRVTLAPRPKAEWKVDCYLNAKQFVVCEVAGLNTKALTLGAFTFQAPVLQAGCSGTRVVLREADPAKEAATAIILDLQPQACAM